MATNLPDITIFLDAAGRFSRNDLSTPIVFAGIAIENRKLPKIREGLLRIINGKKVKWSNVDNNIDLAKKMFQSIVKQQLLASISTYRKSNPCWGKYWEEGEKIYQTGITNAQESMPYAKPSMNLKFNLYSNEAARLWGYYIRSCYPKMASHRPDKTHFQNVSVVIDTDIDGASNQAVIKKVFDATTEMPRVKDLLNLKLEHSLQLKTEEEEPILLIPDFLAGYTYSAEAYGINQNNSWGDLLRSITPLMKKYSSSRIFKEKLDFNEQYPLPSHTFEDILPKRQRERILKNRKSTENKV